ncbi:hypothetical protein ACF1AE_33810 [Streptomyces sp. NPDC014986]|uniref:hypothetical protein n=1 Tax=Streptomyces sp. NPDC014986 TaxID=3364934 RepID=UPI0036FFA8BE
MAAKAPQASTQSAAHDRALLTDFLNRCINALVDWGGEDDAVLSILRDQMEATLSAQKAHDPLPLSWTGLVTQPGTRPGPTVVHLTDSTEGAYALRLDDDLSEALGLLLTEPSDPGEVAENADYDEPDALLLEDETADTLFSYLVIESDARRSGTAHQVHARSEPEGLNYLLAHGPLRPHGNKALITAIRLLHPERFGPTV